MNGAKAGGKLRRQKERPTDGIERATSVTTTKKVVTIKQKGEFHSMWLSIKAGGRRMVGLVRLSGIGTVMCEGLIELR